jgi:hypothetical protein
MQTAVQVETFFEDCDKHVNRDGDPDLSSDGILGSSIEGFDAQVLLDPAKE